MAMQSGLLIGDLIGSPQVERSQHYSFACMVLPSYMSEG